MAAGTPTEIVKCARKRKFNPYNLPAREEPPSSTGPNKMGFNNSHKGMPNNPNTFAADRPYLKEKRLQRTASYHTTQKKPPVQVISARTPRTDRTTSRSVSSAR